MPGPDIKRQLNRSLAWVGLASSAVAVLDVVALIMILKFWVGPEEYGIATTVVTLFSALELVAELGLSSAIIQRDDDDPDRLSTLFWMNILFGLVFYGLVALAAPFMADLHGHHVIQSMFLVFGVNLVLRGGYVTHQALMKKELRFKELSTIRIFANLADFAAKVGTAAAGMGVWCFVWGGLARSVVQLIGLPLAHRWRPRFVFKPRQTFGDIKFGLRASAGDLLFQLYSNIDYQIINVYFGAAALGLYRAAYELVLEPVRFISGVVVGVAFPAFSRLKHDMQAVVDQYIAFTRQNLVVVLSLVALILVSADDMLVVFLKPEYESAADTARILALVGVLRALSYVGPPLLMGLGRPELSLRYQLVAAVILCLLFFVFAEYLGDRLGFMSVALAWAVGYPIAFAALSWLIFAHTGLTLGHYLRRVMGIPACVLAAGLAGVAARWIGADLPAWARLLVVALAIATVEALLLAYLQGISPRSIARSIKEE